MVRKDNLRDGRVRNWFYLENDLLDREDLTIYEKTVYIVIARYVNSDNKAFPSYETIARKGSMAKVQAMRVVKSLTQKGLLKKEVRNNIRNGGSTSNLYTLLNPKPNNKTEGVSDRYPGGIQQILGVVSDGDPNNTSIKKTNLNNVNRTSREGLVEKSGEVAKGEKTGSKEDINDIRKKIRKSLEENNEESIPEENNPRENSSPENNYSGKGKIGNYFPTKRRSAEKELLAKEIAEEMGDGHSLGAFRTIVDKIPQQQIRIFFSIIKDTHLTGRIKNNKGAMFISLAKAYAKNNNINLNFK
jgi:hypothetical protein